MSIKIYKNSSTCIKKLCNKKKHNSDEYYTPRRVVEEMINFIKPEYLRNKIIYLPCDSEDSYFTIVFKEWKDKIGYKELIYTCDDFRTHEDLFRKADFVITNPPFSLNAQFFTMLQKTQVNCLIITIPASGNRAWKYNLTSVKITINLGKNESMFITPQGTEPFNRISRTSYHLITNNRYITNFSVKPLPYIRLFSDYKSPEFYDEYFYNN